MADVRKSSTRGNFLCRLWTSLCRPSLRFTLGGLLGAGFAGGIVFWGGFNTALEMSSTETFCISCHEMRSTVYQELQKTVHWSNPSGVRAICSDCHVPRQWLAKVRRKVMATFYEVPLHLIGAVSTPESFEAARLDMARDVWASMRATDSRECRNCHRFESMAMDRQLRAAQRKHERAAQGDETCIDCHQGIAHTLPDGWEATYDSLTQ